MVILTREERAMVGGAHGAGTAMAMRIVRDAATLLGATELTEIRSAHIDGCLYHGDSGVAFAERLVALGARVRVPTTLNVGALDLVHPGRVRADPARQAMARRQMVAYEAMGCRPTWTCAPYQAGHRPGLGDHVAWGESNAVAFVNSVLGARSNRYGDFLDVCCAIVARAPLVGLHLDASRRATVLVDTSALPESLTRQDAFFPVLGSWLGAQVGDAVAVIDGLPAATTEDQLKALGAAAASTGAVGLFHVAGVTPEAPDVSTALGGEAPAVVWRPSPADIRNWRDRLSTTNADRVDAVGLGSPHFSLTEFARLERVLGDRSLSLPVYVCTGRGVLEALEATGRAERLRNAGVTLVVDTCIVVTPILPERGGVLMTNSGKFAHYTRPNTGYDVIYGSLTDCIETAVAGRVVRDEAVWGDGGDGEEGGT